MDNDLTIKLKLDRTAAIAEDRRFAAEHKAVEQEILAASKGAETAKVSATQQANRDRIREERGRFSAVKDGLKDLAEAERSTTQQAASGLKSLSSAGDAFADSIKTIAGSWIGLQAGEKIIGGIVGLFSQARDRSVQLANQVLATKDALRAIASVAGVKVDNELLLKDAIFNAKTGFRPEEGRAFQESFLGKSQIVRGKNISEEEYEKFQTGAGAMTVAKGIPADLAGDLLGGVLKIENFKAKGQGAAEALERAGRAFAILDAGSGKMAALAPQLNEVFASLTKENKLEGVFRSAGEAAVAVSLAAESNPAEAGTLVTRVSQGMRDFANKDKAEFFKRTGITDKDPYLDMVRKSNEVLKEEVDKGEPIDTVLKRFGFTEQREVRGMSVNFGARETVLKPQLERLNAPRDFGAPQRAIEDFQASETGQMRINQARTDLEERVKGIERSAFQVAKEGAKSKLIREGVLGTPYGNVEGEILGKIPGLGIDPEEFAKERAVKKGLGMIPEQTGIEKVQEFVDPFKRIGRLGAEAMDFLNPDKGREVNKALGGEGVPAEVVPLLAEIRDRLPAKQVAGPALARPPVVQPRP